MRPTSVGCPVEITRRVTCAWPTVNNHPYQVHFQSQILCSVNEILFAGTGKCRVVIQGSLASNLSDVTVASISWDVVQVDTNPPIMAQLQRGVDTALSDGSLSTNRRNHTDVYTCKTGRDRHGVLVQEAVFSARSPMSVERVAFDFLRDLIWVVVGSK